MWEGWSQLCITLSMFRGSGLRCEDRRVLGWWEERHPQGCQSRSNIKSIPGGTETQELPLCSCLHQNHIPKKRRFIMSLNVFLVFMRQYCFLILFLIQKWVSWSSHSLGISIGDMYGRAIVNLGSPPAFLCTKAPTRSLRPAVSVVLSHLYKRNNNSSFGHTAKIS